MMRRGCSAVVISLTALSLSVVYATDYTWNGGASGEWTQAANWQPNTGYPNAADDTAAFTPSAATAVTIGSAVTVQGITVGGTSALTITGAAITLGSGGITNTSTQAVGVSNNLVIATAKTPLAVTGNGTLSSSNPAGPLHLGGVVSGSGGLYKTGAGELHLYGANTFTGNFEAEGNNMRPDGTPVSSSNKGYNKAASSEVFIYDGSALGAGSATFDKGASSSNVKGCRLTLMAPMTVANALILSGDNADGNGSMKLATAGTYRFKGDVSTPVRLKVGCVDNVEVHYEGQVSCKNWHSHDKIGSTGVYSIYYEGKLSVSVLTGGNTASRIYLMSSGNSFNQNQTLLINCMAENAYPASFSGIWRWDSDNTKVDIGGYDQTINKYTVGSYREKGTKHGFLSGEDKPAKVRFVGTEMSDLTFGGCFYGAAGIEWDPQVAERTLTLTNKTAQTTVGEIEVKSGRMKLSNGATFTKLSSFKLADGACFEVASGSGAGFLAYSGEIGSEAALNLANGVNLSFGTLKVGTDVIPEGTELTSATHPALISGAGKITVTGARAKAYWKGASGGRWNDAANWSIGQVPDMNYDVVLTNSSVLVDAAIAPVHAITVGDGLTAATITVTNDNSTLTANYFTIMNKGVVTCAGPFTNETQMSRVHIVCTNLEIFAGGKIDVTQKGWSGGIWTPEHTAVSAYGFGPGGGGLTAGGWSGYSGAWHGGRGSSYWALSKTAKVIYGDAAHPVTAGSGGEMPISWGGEISRLRGWSGGGVVRIEAAKDVTVNGSILANGGGAGVSNNGSSRDTAAAGGSVWITCRTISGAGSVSAEGGSMGDPRMPVTYWRKVVENETDLRFGFPGGGGRIAIDYDPVAQAAANVDGLFISAAAGEHCSTFSSLATRDNWEDAAESGTLHFTDTALVKRLFGKGLSGRVVGLTGLSFDGDLDFTRGFFQPMEEGFTLTVAGDLTVTSKTARLEVGGVCLTNLSSRPTIWGGRQMNLLTVGGDFTVANGGSFAIRAAETNASMRWGAEVRVTGAMTVGLNGYVYASSDGVNLGAPRFLPGSLTVAQGGTLSADKRGGLGLHLDSARQKFGFPDGLHGYYGYGPGGGYKPNAAGHGGKGGRSSAVGSATYGNDNNVYDDEWFPIWPGSGGGSLPHDSANYGAGGTGGGIIHVTTPGAIVVNGTVSADGGMDAFYHTTDWMSNFGAGSGGTVFLFGETFTGGANAKITAKGGDGLQRKNGNNVSATGGGGRIAIWTGYGIHESGTFHTHKRTECPFEFSGSFSAAAGERLVPTTGTQTHTAEELAFSIGGAGTVRFGEYVRIPGARIIIR